MSPDSAFHLAMFHRQAGRLAEAEALLRQIVAAQPGHANAWHQLGAVLLTTGRAAEATEYLARAIALAPDHPALYSDQGVAFAVLGRREEAVASYEKALSLDPNAAPTLRNLADTLFALGKYEEAIATYQRALALAPNEAATHNNLGNVFLQQERLPEAGACYERATRLDPRLLVAHSNLGDILTKLGRPEAGIVCAQRVLALDPNFPDGFLNMGVACWLMARFPDAEACYRRAIVLRPDFINAHANLGILLLLQDRFEEGWPEYEWHWRSKPRVIRAGEPTAALWNGQSVPGATILTYADQGIGDTIQFLRYLPAFLARSHAARVIIECQTTLIPLLQEWRSEQVEFVAKEDAPSEPLQYDLHTPLLRLPLALGQFVPLPMPAPYLQADGQRRTAWRSRLDSGARLRVGLAWAGNPTHADDRRRSIPFASIRPLLEIPEISFVSLQVNPRNAVPTDGLLDCTADLQDFADTAALLAELDLIITVDTGTVHVAGALGRPVWVMLAFIPDWRWGMHREDTPWYPTMRLFRQSQAGDWVTVVEQVAAALPKFERHPARAS